MVLLAKNYHYIKNSNIFFFEFVFRFFWPARVPGGWHRAREAGPDREISKNTEQQKKMPGPGRPGIRNFRFTDPIKPY